LKLTNVPLTAPKKEWSLTDWINNFLQDDDSGYYDDLYEEYGDGMTDGDDLDLDDDGLVESVMILGLAAALVFLLMYRQQRQQAARRQEEARRQPQQPQQGGVQGAAAAGNQQQPQAQERGFFPQPGDPNFGQWGAGGVGH
jgi:SEL1 protein